MESFLEKYRARCYNLFHFEMKLTTIKAKMIRTMKVKNPHYPMDEKSEKEFHDLHLAWCDETSQFMLEVERFESKKIKGVKVDVEDILNLCNQPKVLTIWEAEIYSMILELQEKVKKIIYVNSTSCEDESFTHLKAKKYEV